MVLRPRVELGEAWPARRSDTSRFYFDGYTSNPWAGGLFATRTVAGAVEPFAAAARAVNAYLD